MVRSSRIATLLCTVAAVAVHLGGLWTFTLDEPAQIEAGQGSASAALGNSFADMATGVQTALQTEEVSDAPEQEEIEAVQPENITPREPVEAKTLEADPAEIAPLETAKAEAVTAEATPSTVTAEQSQPAEPSVTPQPPTTAAPQPTQRAENAAEPEGARAAGPDVLIPMPVEPKPTVSVGPAGDRSVAVAPVAQTSHAPSKM
ncbi:MAG: hypothetical protein AAFV38_06380, partial [Pseudomonadota bacterium]